MDSIISSPSIQMGDEDKVEVGWLKEFEEKKGRPLRILFVGNIANIAYGNAKHLRQIGVDVDVLCCDYYHIMGCTEWEDIVVSHYTGSDYFPYFDKKEVGDYQSPKWFIQGPFWLCTEYLKSKFCNNRLRTQVLYHLIRLSRKSIYHYYGCKIIGYILAARLKLFFSDSKKFLRKIFKKNQFPSKKCWKDEDVESLIQEFESLFPERPDQLTFEDLEPFISRREIWRSIASNYDIVQCYGSDPIWPLIANVHPYVAFEHGTLREFTMHNDSLNRLVALAYAKAKHVFISNGDCLDYAKRLKIKNYSFALHPIELRPNHASDNIRTAMKKRFNADVILFCPMRHDWTIKGPDIHLNALPAIKQKVQARVVLILNQWGSEVEKSKQLISALGCEDQVIWLQPLCRQKLIEMMQGSDVVLDQMVLPCFGGIVPQALAVGTPVIMSYKPESTEWMFAEPAPILSAFNSEDVICSVVKAIEPEWRINFKKRAENWVNKYHHPDIMVHEHLNIYRNLVVN